MIEQYFTELIFWRIMFTRSKLLTGLCMNETLYGLIVLHWQLSLMHECYTIKRTKSVCFNFESIYIYYIWYRYAYVCDIFVWGRYDNIPQCIGSSLNANYEWIATCDDAWFGILRSKGHTLTVHTRVQREPSGHVRSVNKGLAPSGTSYSPPLRANLGGKFQH